MISIKDQTVSIRKGEKENSVSPEVCKIKEFNFDALRLEKGFTTLFEKDLRTELVYLGKNTRPDALFQNYKALIRLKRSSQERIVEEGQKVYFFYKEGVLHFSEESSPLWIKIKSIGNSLFFESKVVISSEDTDEVYQESAKIELEKTSFQSSLEEPSVCFEKLSLATWAQPDKFFEQYGGEKYKDRIGAYRLKLNFEGAYHFVKDSDLLYYSAGEWKIGKKGMDLSSYPIAEVKVFSPAKIVITAWDVCGMHERVFKFSCEKLPVFNLRVEEIFSKIRQRSKSQVTCKVAGKTLLLKNGDWLLKKENHWKLLRTFDEIQKYLDYELDGELFVFDQIEKNESIPVFKGHLFDTMRTQVQVVRVQLAEDIKNPQKKKKKLLKNVVSTSEEILKAEDFDEEDDEDDEELLRLTGESSSHEIEK